MKINSLDLIRLTSLESAHYLSVKNLISCSKKYKDFLLKVQEPLVKKRAEELRKKMLKALKKARCHFKETKMGFILKNTHAQHDDVNKILIQQGVDMRAMKCRAYGDDGVGYNYLVPYAPQTKKDTKRDITLFFPEKYTKIFIRVDKKTGKVDTSAIEEGAQEDEEGEENEQDYFSALD
jgi:hypothetical protein